MAKAFYVDTSVWRDYLEELQNTLESAKPEGVTFD